MQKPGLGGYGRREVCVTFTYSAVPTKTFEFCGNEEDRNQSWKKQKRAVQPRPHARTHTAKRVGNQRKKTKRKTSSHRVDDDETVTTNQKLIRVDMTTYGSTV